MIGIAALISSIVIIFSQYMLSCATVLFPCASPSLCLPENGRARRSWRGETRSLNGKTPKRSPSAELKGEPGSPLTRGEADTTTVHINISSVFSLHLSVYVWVSRRMRRSCAWKKKRWKEKWLPNGKKCKDMNTVNLQYKRWGCSQTRCMVASVTIFI